MAIPTATVKVQVLQIKSIPAVTLGAGHTRYARASFRAGAGPVFQTGRSRPIPATGGHFSLLPEADTWIYEAAVNPGTAITITIEIHEDRGDDAPPPVSTFVETVSDPWAPGEQTTPSLVLWVTRQLVNATDAAFLARARQSRNASGTLAIPQGYAVQIEEIDGLYKPVTGAVPPGKGSAKVAGYISEDNVGRIFVNRVPDGTWSKDTQYIEVSARVTAFGTASIPAGAKIKWTLTDPDDPTNDAPEFHRDWGKYVDANDYNAAGSPAGARPNDNALAHSPGNLNEDLLFASSAAGSARWAQATGGPAVTPVSRGEAQSNLTIVSRVTATSKIRVHCMNVLGTSLKLKADLIGVPATIPAHPAFTGVMTMWSRLDVEVVKMASAHSLAGVLPSVASFFLPACVQLDLQLERAVAGPLDKPVMAGTRPQDTPATLAWVDNAGVFTNKGRGGWFFLGAARLAVPLPTARPTALFTGTNYTLSASGAFATLEVAGSFPNADYAEFRWTDAAGNTQEVGFGVFSPTVSGGQTSMRLMGNDVTPDFTGHDADGSLRHAMQSQLLFFPRHQRTRTATSLAPGGFGVPTAGARVEILPRGAVSTSGRSPAVSVGTDDHFAGRTVLFTHHPKFSTRPPTVSPRPTFNAEILSTVVHEFLHAFGMPHKCGNWSWRTPRRPSAQKSCCMNYFNTWLLDASKNLLPGTVGNQGNDMCGRHLMEVRRVHLERNPGFGW
ncbi:MAG: hypothetical protein H7Y20_16250 [Bryobacteraceae bacterium]|nr:hypothetical protein [Bryobacteraceae bacterium]